uniref:Uncharacterized protein n=1 Tax=Meloidogyne javanica TaxID=6303 RepID=A0A915MHN8_MELJA
MISLPGHRTFHIFSYAARLPTKPPNTTIKPVSFTCAMGVICAPSRLKEYKGSNFCNVAFDENGDNYVKSLLNYNKVKETGCFVDLLTDSGAGQFEFNATVANGDMELKDCLNSKSNGINSNMFPFAYSIDIGWFATLSKGPPYNKCLKQRAKCLKRTGLEIGWSKKSTDKQFVSSKWMASKLFKFGDPTTVCSDFHDHDSTNKRANHIEQERDCLFTNPDFMIGSSIFSFFVQCLAMIALYPVIFRSLREREKARDLRRKEQTIWTESALVLNALMGGARMARQIAKSLLKDQLLLELSVQTSLFPSPSEEDEEVTEKEVLQIDTLALPQSNVLPRIRNGNIGENIKNDEIRQNFPNILLFRLQMLISNLTGRVSFVHRGPTARRSFDRADVLVDVGSANDLQVIGVYGYNQNAAKLQSLHINDVVKFTMLAVVEQNQERALWTGSVPYVLRFSKGSTLQIISQQQQTNNGNGVLPANNTLLNIANNNNTHNQLINGGNVEPAHGPPQDNLQLNNNGNGNQAGSGLARGSRANGNAAAGSGLHL